jgi:hypothetical protein
VGRPRPTDGVPASRGIFRRLATDQSAKLRKVRRGVRITVILIVSFGLPAGILHLLWLASPAAAAGIALGCYMLRLVTTEDRPLGKPA